MGASPNWSTETLMFSFVVCSNRAGGTLPKALRSIAAQTVQQNWQCILVDNGFSDDESREVEKIAEGLFLPGMFRMIREDNLGLGYARRTGFAAAKGEWIVMLDDDNYLEKEFAAELMVLLVQFPETGGISPCVYPILPQPGEKWHRSVANRCLSVTDLALAALPDLPNLYNSSEAMMAPRPPGGGMIIRRAVALRWADEAVKIGTLFLGRTGTKPIGAEDAEIWRTLLAMELPVLVTGRLRIAHDLPASRFGWRYLWRLNYWMAWSYAWIDHIGKNLASGAVEKPSLIQNLRHLKLLVLATTKEERIGRWMDWAGYLGRLAGIYAVATHSDLAHRERATSLETVSAGEP